MKVIRTIWNDVKRGENIDLYITVVVAFIIGILSLLGYADQTLATSIILAALGILTASSLRDKHGLERVHSDLSKLDGTINERLQTTRNSEMRLLQKLSTTSDDILAKVIISSSIHDAGLIDITMQPRNINWDELFEKVSEIDVFFTYARTWRNSNSNLLDQFVRRNGCRLRVVLPNPENDVILQELSNRFAKSPEEFRNLIHEATRDYLKMREIGERYGAKVELWHASVTPMFTVYRFDKTVILALGSYRSTKGDVPHFICQPEGSLYRYATGEFETLTGNDGRLIATQIE